MAVAGWTLEVTLLNPALIFAASLLAGAGSTLWFLSQAPFMMEISNEDNRTLLFSLNYGLSTLAGAAGNLFAGQLPQAFGRMLGIGATSAGAYQAVLIASLIITALGILPVIFIREAPRTHPEEGAPRRSGLKEIFTRPLTLKLVLPNLILGWGASLLVGYFNVFYVEEWSLSDQRLGALFSATSFVVGVGTLIGPRLEPVMRGKIRAVLALQVVGIASLLALGFSPVLWISEVGLLVRGTVMMTAGALYSAFSMEKTRPEERGAVNSLMNLSWQVGWAVGPYISGLVQVSYGFGPLFIATSIFYAAAILVTWKFFGREKYEIAGSPQPL